MHLDLRILDILKRKRFFFLHATYQTVHSVLFHFCIKVMLL